MCSLRDQQHGNVSYFVCKADCEHWTFTRICPGVILMHSNCAAVARNTENCLHMRVCTPFSSAPDLIVWWWQNLGIRVLLQWSTTRNLIHNIADIAGLCMSLSPPGMHSVVWGNEFSELMSEAIPSVTDKAHEAFQSFPGHNGYVCSPTTLLVNNTSHKVHVFA